MLATARFCVGPLTGQPVSVIQTGLPPTAALVLFNVWKKISYPKSIEFTAVV